MAHTFDPETQSVERAPLLTFLIADVRGYTRFTRERGDAAAATLASRFADIARDDVEARGGEVIELRGDEVLAVFTTPVQAVRAAIDLQLTCAEETRADPSYPFLVGIGIDSGPAVPVEEGYRGVAINLAARLCSAAGAGQVLLTDGLARAIGDAAADIDFDTRGPTTFKGFEEPIDVVMAVSRSAISIPQQRTAPTTQQPLPVELDDQIPMVGRTRELRWLRGTWRQVRRGTGRVVALSGPPGIGKTRVTAALAERVAAEGGNVRYVGAGGTAAADARLALRETAAAIDPSLLVIDDVDALGPTVIGALDEEWAELTQRPALTVVVLRDPGDRADIDDLVRRCDHNGDGHRSLMPLTRDEVRSIVELYAGASVDDAPVESMVRASGGLPSVVHEFASQWAQSEAARRLEAAAEFMAAVRDRRDADLDFANNVIELRLGRLFQADLAPIDGTDCPYKGLASFTEDDATWFFGRERLVGELAARIVGTGLLAVVGASGSGKSSVLAAGLLPSLSAGLLPGSERWRRVALRPGEQPMAALRDAFCSEASDPVAEAVASLEPQQRIVLVIDQFEELFTLCTVPQQRDEFVDVLSAAARTDPERVVVVLALRSDFYGATAVYPALAAAISDNHVLVAPLSRDELQRAVSLPARRAGVHVEASLIDALVRDTADQPGALPLVSTALVELWQSRTDRWIRMSAYGETGGVHGAVARLAEASYAELGGMERAAARRVLLRLTAAAEDGGAVTRRRVSRDEFDLHRDEAARLVVERFTQDRLLTTERDAVEVAHEALLREWPRLRQWLAEDEQGRQLRQHLAQAARTWSTSEHDSSELYRGARLSATLDWASDHAADLNELERDFIAASRQAAETDAEAQRRTNRRLRSLLAGAALLLAIATIAGALALAQRSSARRQTHRAEDAATRTLAQSLGAQAVAEPRIDLAMLLAREAVAVDPSLQTRSDLLTTLMRAPSVLRTYHWTADRNSGVMLSPDSKTLLIADNNGNWVWRDVATGREIRHNTDDVLGFGPRGTVIIAGSHSSLVLRDLRSYRVVRVLQAPSFARSADWSASTLGLADHGRTIVASYSSSHDSGQGPVADKVRIVRVDTRSDRFGRFLAVDHDSSALLMPDGVRLMVVTGDSTTIVDTRTGGVLRRFPVGADGAALSPDGRTTALTTADGRLQFLDLRTGKRATAIGATDGTNMQFTPDGRTLVAAGGDGVVQLWDVASRTVTRTLAGHAGPIHAMAISHDGTTLYTGSFDTNVVAWDLTGRRGVVDSYYGGDADPAAGAWTLAISPDSRTMAEGAANGDVVVSDLMTHRQLARFHTGPGVVGTTTFSQDGRALLVSGDQVPPSPASTPWLQIWALQPHPHLVRAFDTRSWSFLSWSAWSPDGRTIAATGYLRDQHALAAGAVGEWDAQTGRPIAPALRIKNGYGLDVAFAPHGTTVVVGSYGFGYQVVDPAAGNVIRVLDNKNSEYAFGAAYSPDGRTIATAGWDGVIRLWDARTYRQVATIPNPGQDVVEGVAWSPDGRTLAATDWGPRLRLYDVASRQEIGPPLPLETLSGDLSYDPWPQFTPDGSRVVVSGTTDLTYVLPVTVDAWVHEACTIAGRDLTRAEWAHYLPGRRYHAMCPGHPR